MKKILAFSLLPTACLTLSAQSSGRVMGKVTNTAGKSVPNVTIVMKRLDVNWSKEFKGKETGTYTMAGLEPKDYEFTYSAAGYAPFKMIGHIPAGETLTQDAVLKTQAEAAAEVVKNDPNAQGKIAEKAGAEAFNSGIAFYNTQNFTEALPLLEKAYQAYKEALEKSKDDKNAPASSMFITERVYGISLYETGKADESLKAANWAKAEPILTTALSRIPEKDETKGQRVQVLKALIGIADDKKDTATSGKLQILLDKIEPPSATGDYNKAVDAYNAGNFSEVKTCAERAIKKDPKFPESYYLLGVAEFALSNPKVAKLNLVKYLELAPNGKKAAEVKELLEDPSLKKIKL